MSLSGLHGDMGNPTFTSWATLTSSDEAVMEFATYDIANSFACLYLETTNWETWTDSAT